MKILKILIYFAIVLTTTVLAHSQQEGPEWKAKAVVVDQAGKPIEGADVTIGYYVPSPSGQSVATDSQRGKSDTNGVFSASGRTRTIDLFFSAVKTGYYKTRISYELGATYQYDPVKWSPTQTLVLKRIEKPIPMYAKHLSSNPPVMGESIGFDLMVGDWIVPHGKGQAADVIFRRDYSKKARNDYEHRITVSFPNEKDGIQECAAQKVIGEGSELRSPHEAPDVGYQQQVVRENIAHPGQPTKFDFDEKRNYFFRVRTVLDEKGNVKSAHYGKIYGDFMRFRYYLNPTPNDRNVEFDPEKNLIKGLATPEQVREP
jgi:hypothetical protein